MSGNQGDFVQIADLARQIGCDRFTLRRRVRREGIDVWHDPHDRRRRLIARRDAEYLLTPSLVTQRTRPAEASAA